MPDALLTPKVVAERFGVTANAVSRWADAGKLPYLLTAGRQRRFRLEDVEQLERTLADEASAS